MQHATCTLRFSDPQEFQNLQRQVSTVRTRLVDLRKKLESQQTFIFNKAMIYKMVATLADFDPNYQALDEIVLDSARMELLLSLALEALRTKASSIRVLVTLMHCHSLLGS